MRTLRALAAIFGLILLAVACRQSSGNSGSTPGEGPEATVEQGLQGPPGPYSGIEPTIVGDPLVVKQFIRRLDERGLKTTAIDIKTGIRIQYCVDAPRRSYEIAGGRLHIFLYQDEQTARLAAQRVPPNADCGPMDWAYDVRYFLHGELIVFLASENAEVLKVLENLAGPAFACGPGPGDDWVSSCPN